jgi:hypothetical protein
MKRHHSKLKSNDDAQPQEHGNHKENQKQATEPPSYSRRKAVSQGLTVLSAYALTGLLPTNTSAELSTGANRLVLQEPDLSKQLNDVFAEIKRDKQKEREFIDNPVGVLANRFTPREFQETSRPQIANANRVLYALLANDQFLKWLRSYQRGLEGTRQVNKGKVLRDFAEAMARFGDPEFFQGILEAEAAQWVSPLDKRGHWAVAVDKVVAVSKYVLWGGKMGANEFINPAEMRSLLDMLAQKVVAKAKAQKAAGELQKQIVEVQ